jgi:hypothetical protein
MSKTHWYRGLIAVSAGLFLSTAASAQVDPNFHIYLAFGQSNMEGSAALPNPAFTQIPRFQNLSAVTCGNRTQGKWMTAASPMVRCDSKYSLLEYFGKTMTEGLPSNVKVGVVAVAVGGTAITGFIKNQAEAYYRSQPTWMQQFAANYGSNPYNRLVAVAKVAQQTGVIKGILFHQGETDGGSAGWGDKVKGVYNSLLADLGLKAADVPFLAGETYNNTGANNAINNLPRIIPTAYVISSKGAAIGSDNLHFSVAGYNELGKRYAQQMLKLLPATSAIAPSELAANLTYDADYAVFDVRGARVAGFHATDAVSMDAAWAGIKKIVPPGIYWVRNGSTGTAEKFVNGR